MKKITYEANIRFKLIAEVDTDDPITKDMMDAIVADLIESEVSSADTHELEIVSTMEVT